MKSELLHVVAVIANPIRWKSRISLYKRFEQHMIESGVNLVVVECAYGNRDFELAEGRPPGVTHVGVRARTLVWNKENLVNIGISRLPDNWEYVAWIDADVEFRRKTWAEDTVHALQHYDVVQPWSNCYDLGPDDDHMQHHRSFAKLYTDGKPIVQGPKAKKHNYEFAHPGYAWAATRGAIDAVGGLVETAALGAADHHMALALIGRVDDSIPGNISKAYRRPLMQWQARAMKYINTNLGVVPGTIEHGWHGSKEARKYVDRWEILIRNEFDPYEDLYKNSYGVLELADTKPRLRKQIDAYFRQRNEDANSL